MCFQEERHELSELVINQDEKQPITHIPAKAQQQSRGLKTWICVSLLLKDAQL